MLLLGFELYLGKTSRGPSCWSRAARGTRGPRRSAAPTSTPARRDPLGRLRAGLIVRTCLFPHKGIAESVGSTLEAQMSEMAMHGHFISSPETARRLKHDAQMEDSNFGTQCIFGTLSSEHCRPEGRPRRRPHRRRRCATPSRPWV